MGVLTAVIWVPVFFGFLTMFNEGNKAKLIALLGGIISFLVSLPLLLQFDFSTSNMQFEENFDWISTFNIRYHLGVDGISVLLVVLNSFITALVIIAGWQVIKNKQAQYFAAFLIMSGFINGAFAALDAILFYAFFEAMLIPMYLVIGVWGGPRRIYASFKFFLYTLLGSLLMLVALIYMYYQNGANSFEILDFQKQSFGMTAQVLIFIAFFFSFAVKVPMFPVHTWLPDAHVEAPTGGSMVLAAITLKLGAYGFFRFMLPIVPDASRELGWIIVTLSLIAVVYIGLIAFVQSDMKKLVAYSSISHMGFVTLGLFMFDLGKLNVLAVEGALVQMVSHGFVSAAMFMSIGVLYDRLHTRNISDYGGVVNSMPVFSAFALLFSMANSGLPATSGFVGEFMIILGALQVNFWYAFIAATTLIIGAAYTLFMYKRVYFGDVVHESVKNLKDINSRELSILLILAFCVLLMGIFPEIFTRYMHTSIQNFVELVAVSKLGG